MGHFGHIKNIFLSFSNNLMIKPLINEQNLIRKIRERETYSSKTKTRKQALVEEAEGKKANSWNCVYYCKYIVQLKWTFSGSMMRLQAKNKFDRRTTLHYHTAWLQREKKHEELQKIVSYYHINYLHRKFETRRNMSIIIPRAYATRKHARELYEPTLPKIPFPPETNNTQSINISIAQKIHNVTKLITIIEWKRRRKM